MAVLRVNPRSTRPTLSELAEAARTGLPQEILAGTTREDVLAACKLRDVEVREGRIDVARVPDIYFGLRMLRLGEEATA